MKAQLGKPTGLALALLATLLATFLAMGVFAVAQANSHNAERSFPPTRWNLVTPWWLLSQSTDYSGLGSVTETLPTGFTYVSSNAGIILEQANNQVRFAFTGLDSFTYTVTAPDAEGTYDFSGTFTFGSPGVTVVVGGNDEVTVAVAPEPTMEPTPAPTMEPTPDPTMEPTPDPTVQPKATTKTTPGSNQSLMLEADVDFTSTDSITVNLKDFGVPSSIAPAQISINVDGDDPETTPGTGANPSDVEVDGTKVTLVGPYETGGNNPVNLAAQGTSITKIVFRRAAGITLPIRHGEYDIKVSTSSTSEDEGDGRENLVNVLRDITVSPSSGTRGTEVTISGKGFTDGTADIMIGDDYTINADVDDGAFTVTVDSAVKNNAGNSVFDGSVSLESGDMDDDRKTDITISDAATKGVVDAEGEPVAKTFEIKPSFTFDPESPTPGQDVTINLVDISGEPTSVTFTGAAAIVDGPDSDPNDDADDSVDNIRDSDNDAETLGGWKVQVPGNTRIGNVRVTILHPDYLDDDGDMIALTKTITIGTNDLTVTPTTVVPRQTISIDGGGFTVRGTVDLNEVVIGGKEVSSTSVPMADRELINNNGDISFDVTVPQDVTPGNASVKVTDSGDRVGTASITIATAELTISPAESLRGETITVSGTGFPANDLVLIKYNDATVDTSSTSPTGTFEQEVAVPAGEDINPGGTYTIEAVSQVNSPDVSAAKDHKIKAPVITLSPDTATPGSNLTISGENFKGFLRVSLIEIGGQDVTPVPAPQTDKWGAFSTSDIQVPQLNLTRHAVKVVVGDDDGSDGDATEFLTLVGAVASNAPADLFADLIEAGALDRIFRYDNTTQEWFLYDPDPGFEAANSLETLEAGDIIWIQLKAAAEVQGQNLLTGWSLITVQ